MKQLNNQKGLTLLEILATMTILFIIGGIVYGMFSQMFINFNNSENRISARQEANLIIAHLTTIHQKSTEYTIEKDSEHFFITNADGNSMKLGHKNYKYSLVIDGTLLSDDPDDSISIKPKRDPLIPIELTLDNERGDKFTVTTTLSRLTAR